MSPILASKAIVCGVGVGLSGILVSLLVNINVLSAQAQTNQRTRTNTTPVLIDATMPNKILEIAKGFGTASLDKDILGDPRITGIIDGQKYTIHFYGCLNGKDCDDIQFYTYWTGGRDATLDKINEWNRKTRFGKAYLDTDGDTALEMTVNIDYGVSTKNLEDNFSWWNKTVQSVVQDILTE
jgi:hypothetical protein